MLGFDKVMSGENMFIGWVGSYGTVMLEELSDEQVINDLINLAEKFTKKQIPRPKRYFM